MLPKATCIFSAAPMKIPMAFFAETKKILKFIWNHKGPQITKTVWRKEQSWKPYTSSLQSILQSYGNQNSMVLAYRQTYKPMDQGREPGNKLMHI